MKNNRYLIGFALLVAGALPAFSQVSNNNEDGVYKVDQRLAKDFVPGQVLVKFKDASPVNVRRASGRYQSIDKSNVDAVLQKFGVETMEKVLPNENPKRTLRRAKAFNGETIQEKDLSQLYQVKLSNEHAYDVMPLIKELEALDEVEFAEPNYKVYLMDANIAGNLGGNPYATQQWYLDDYGVKQLWNKPIINSKRPVIAILDTGVDMTHPDLKDNLWTNTAEAEGESGYDNDGNGFPSDVHGWDFINNTPNIKDFNMHGTHVAGIAAAANNGIGIIGANPMALIMPISVMQSDGTGDVATIIKGIDYAVANGAIVLNLSLGTYANSRALRQALEKAYQSAVIVAAAGNDGRCINTPHYPDPCKKVGPLFPAAYSFVLGVQATTNTGSMASFSNYDDDGNTYSIVTTLQDPDGFNYELKAPGTNMLSTIPGGKYKVLNGTSMATPLVAGAISALKMVKQYDTQEILWGDLLHTDNIAQAYAVTNRPAELDMLKIQMQNRKDLTDETEEDYSGDHEIDAGEIVSIYPVIRTTFGEASNIKLKLEMGDEFEDASTVDIITGQADFGMHLDAYGKGVSLNPLVLKVNKDVANARHIKMKVVATCDESNVVFEKAFTLVVFNMHKIGGMISNDMTLTADKKYLVTTNLAIPEGVTLTVMPGTTILFEENIGMSCNGHLKIKGTKELPITMSSRDEGSYWAGINSQNETLEYCKLRYMSLSNSRANTFYSDCDFQFCKGWCFLSSLHLTRCNVTNCYSDGNGMLQDTDDNRQYTNCVNNQISYLFPPTNWQGASKMNYFNNYSIEEDTYRTIGVLSNEPIIVHADNPPYLGTSKENIARNYIYEIGAPFPLNMNEYSYGSIDLSNMRTIPYSEAHGIVWKVCVNGKDVQDEYEDLAPLGVGRHKFEVYFNRPMNKAIAPQVLFGVRDPWTQQAVAEDGSWNEEGNIYTAYKTITGKTKSDGINRIYVYGAEDNEFFEIPYEKTRFNINIQAAGSMATGFAAEAGLGRVELTWDNSHNDFEDAMGFNIYRFNPEVKRTIPAHYDENWNWIEEKQVVDTICINKDILDIETTDFSDYDVIPGHTYYYYYKVLSTDLQEFDVSNVVAATPLTATLGDANGSGDVDVADVITTVNYAAGMDPKPFIFEAADMNADTYIDILDVVGIIQVILNAGAPARTMTEATATYSIENGIVYVDSPVELAGVQVQLTTENGQTINVASDLDGFEHAATWLSENDYLFLAYNLSGKALSAGKHALLNIGNAEVASIRLSDATGHNVQIIMEDATGIETAGKDVKTVKGVYNLKGQRVVGNNVQMRKLPKGVYIVDGVKVMK